MIRRKNTAEVLDVLRQVWEQHWGTKARSPRDASPEVAPAGNGRRDVDPGASPAGSSPGPGEDAPGPEGADRPAESPGTSSPGTSSPGTSSPGTSSPGTSSPGTSGRAARRQRVRREPLLRPEGPGPRGARSAALTRFLGLAQEGVRARPPVGAGTDEPSPPRSAGRRWFSAPSRSAEPRPAEARPAEGPSGRGADARDVPDDLWRTAAERAELLRALREVLEPSSPDGSTSDPDRPAVVAPWNAESSERAVPRAGVRSSREPALMAVSPAEGAEAQASPGAVPPQGLEARRAVEGGPGLRGSASRGDSGGSGGSGGSRDARASEGSREPEASPPEAPGAVGDPRSEMAAGGSVLAGSVAAGSAAEGPALGRAARGAGAALRWIAGPTLGEFLDRRVEVRVATILATSMATLIAVLLLLMNAGVPGRAPGRGLGMPLLPDATAADPAGAPETDPATPASDPAGAAEAGTAPAPRVLWGTIGGAEAAGGGAPAPEAVQPPTPPVVPEAVIPKVVIPESAIPEPGPREAEPVPEVGVVPPTSSFWRIQVRALESWEGATKIQDYFRDLGYEDLHMETGGRSSGSEPLYTVFVGKFRTLEEARRTCSRILEDTRDRPFRSGGSWFRDALPVLRSRDDG